MVNDEFIGAGWAFPLRTDATGGIALVTREREIEESIRLILGTAYGERPMRPEFGCGIHDEVFSPADASTFGRIAADVRASLRRWEPRIAVQEVDVAPDPDDASTLYIDIRYTVGSSNDPAEPRLPLLRDPRGGVTDGPAGPEPGRPPLPGSRRRREAARPAALPGVDGPQRLGPGRHPHRGVRLDDRPAPLPPQPGPGPPLRQVPRADRRPPLPAGGRPRRGHLLALRAPAGRRPDRRRDAGGDDPHRDRRCGRLHDARGPADRPGHARPRAAPPPTARSTSTAPPRPRNGRDFAAFEAAPVAGNLLLVGISEPAPANAVRLDFRCTIEGVGVDPTWPPLAWEAWTGDGWTACELERDTTGGLNRDGEVILHVPAGPRRLGRREAPGRLASRPRHGAGGGPAVLLRVAERAWRDGLHGRRHDGRRARRRGRRRDRRRLRGRGRAALPAQAPARRPRRPADDRPRLRRRGRLAGVDAGPRLLRLGAGGSPLRPGCRGRRDLLRPRRPRAGRIGARLRGGAAEGTAASRSTSTSPAAAGSATSPRGRSAS